jgi:hypothetical protein
MDDINRFFWWNADITGRKNEETGTAHWNGLMEALLTVVVSQLFREGIVKHGTFYYIGNHRYWWSSTELNPIHRLGYLLPGLR